MSPETSPSAGARPWRWALVIYFGALVIATHWPSLALSSGAPTSDKFLHAVAFGTLTVLLWRSGWFRARWMAGLVVLVWCLFDEWSQGWRWINRHSSVDDAIANVAGVLVATAWLVALRPIGGEVNRRRIALEQLAFDRIWMRPAPWIALVAAAFVAGLLSIRLPWHPPGATQAGAAVLVAIIVCGHLIVFLWLRERRRVADAHPELAGTPPLPPAAVQTRLLSWPIVAAAVGILLIFTLVLVAPPLYAKALQLPATADVAPRVVRWIGQLAPDVEAIVDLAGILLAFAALTVVYRVRLARFYDQAERCRHCSHDLRGTPAPAGEGRCSECGLAFQRTT